MRYRRRSIDAMIEGKYDGVYRVIMALGYIRHATSIHCWWHSYLATDPLKWRYETAPATTLHDDDNLGGPSSQSNCKATDEDLM